MTKIWAVAALLLLCFAGRAEDTPAFTGFANAKVGDWVEYKMKAAAGKAGQVEMSQKRKITAKDEKSITIKTEVTVMGRTMPAREVTVPLDKPYNPGVNDPDAKVQKLEEGDEKLTINGKDYDTHWYHYKGTNKAGAPVDGKIWIGKGIPLGGMVKMEGSSERGNVTLELIGSGSE